MTEQEWAYSLSESRSFWKLRLISFCSFHRDNLPMVFCYKLLGIRPLSLFPPVCVHFTTLPDPRPVHLQSVMCLWS